MNSADNKSCIIINGEIYNHLELKSQLENQMFNGHSDTETVVNYFTEYNIKKNLQNLNGIFAFAFLDLKREYLYLARDRFGVKPLYYYHDGDKLIFSSEIRPLKAILHPKVSRGSLMTSLKMRYISSPSTIYENINKVEPGQLLIFNLKEDIKLEKTYFISPAKTLGSNKNDFKRLVLEYGGLLEKAVEKQLMSDVEIGILLSGGIDSALIAAISKEKSKSEIKAFTVGFEGNNPEIDETEYAIQTAEILGLRHYIKKIKYADFFNSIEKIFEIVEEPIGTTSIFPMYYLSESAAARVKVVLSGQGADEPLGGYNKYKALPWLETFRLLMFVVPTNSGVELLYKRHEALRRLITSFQCKNDIDALIAFNSILSTKEITGLLNSSNQNSNSKALLARENHFKQIWTRRSPGKSSLKNRFLYYDLRTSLPDDLLMYTDKLTMHFNMECRVPFLDNDLIAFIESIDSRYKFNSRRSKIIHKQFAREYLPSSIIERKKLGFRSPTKSWFIEQRPEIENLILTNLGSNTCFNIDAVKKIISNHSKSRNLEKQILLLLSLSYILKNND